MLSRVKVICPCCLKDNRIVVLWFHIQLLQYRCPFCLYVLNDEDIYRAVPADKR